MSRRYSQAALRTIGQQASNRLPPASAMQAMFLYEMQRESENERLFQGALFDLARIQDDSESQQSRLENVEVGVQALRQEVANRDLDERLATSNVRADHLQSRVRSQEERTEEIKQWVTATTATVTSIDELLHSHAEQLNTIDTATAANADAIPKIETKFETSIGDLTTRLDEQVVKIEKHDVDLRQLASGVANAREMHQSTMHDIAAKCAKFTSDVAEHDRTIDEIHKTIKEHADSIKVHAGDLASHTKSIDTHSKELVEHKSILTTHTTALSKHKSELATHTTTIASHTTATARHTADILTLTEELDSADKDIEVLFEERDGFAERLEAAEERISKLEDLVRTLTAQLCHNGGGSSDGSSPAVQRLEVQTPDGTPLELSVPRGRGWRA